MNNDTNFFCYSRELHHFLAAFHEKCYNSKINQNSGNRYWIYRKSDRLDKLIELFNETKIIANSLK